MTDWAVLYRDHVAAVGALAGDLSDEQLASTVPGTPAWTVRDLLAHLAGGAADSVTGRMDDAPSPEWTARHVGERAHLPVGALVEELETNADAVAHSTVDNPRPAIVWDIAVHHADLHEALGHGRLPDHLWTPVLDMVAPMKAPDLVGTVEPYELFRGIFSRRSRAQMQAWGIDDDGIESVCIFGPRDDDQPVPPAGRG
ncbi:maleylpyruvate isomerase N-terminal domain-containing protein [Nocardioides sp.]|uniref:maleylpyruvate isomerase N-terminal domain-containing protein n=1 Tax=Nocardioides sp. TaxID=35761 RepID=UPI00271AB2F6|nr:maleylpyruvate isomerase N-terminal domain-containing protein [Nocardioides sp.]MDO9456247.1 maleylpyruvate isomerase N-terminal domain-containing protein [Nocardioides sp.]